MSYYECFKCKYNSKRITDMKRHLNRKIKCPKNIESYNYSDEELNNMSLILHNDESQTIKNNLTKNICNYCLKTFSRYDNLKRHQKAFCKKRINEENKKINNIIIVSPF